VTAAEAGAAMATGSAHGAELNQREIQIVVRR
jgi:hypothetical protein